MTSKVLLIDEKIHRKLKKYCVKNNITLRKFVGDTIKEAMKKGK